MVTNRFGSSQGIPPKPQHTDTLGSVKAKRDQRPAGIQLLDGTVIEGFIHILPTTRPMDLLNNRDEPFLAVTTARVSNSNGETRHVEFVAVNKTAIAILYELHVSLNPQEQQS